MLRFGHMHHCDPSYRCSNGNHRKERRYLCRLMMWRRMPLGEKKGLYFFPVPVNLYSPFGTTISNRAPLPGSPVSVIVMPVIARISRREPPQLIIGWHNSAVVKNTRMLRVGAELRVGSGGRRGKRHDEKKKDDAGAIRSDTVTQFVIVHGFASRNLYGDSLAERINVRKPGLGMAHDFLYSV